MKEKIKLASRQILLYLVEGFIRANEPFDRHRMYKKTIEDFYDWQELDKKKFSNDLKRLEREGYIKIYQTKEKNIIELSGKGKNKVDFILSDKFEIEYPQKWDRKWRIIIFDIPEKKKRNRDILRHKLIEIGCIRLQDSVFVFPFDCKEIIDYYKNLFNIKTDIQYIIAETIETEIDLVDKFIQTNILNKKML